MSETQKNMIHVLVSLIPIMGISTFFYGINVLVTILVTVASCVAAEILFNSLKKVKPDVNNLEIITSGVILAMTMPSNTNPVTAMLGGIILILLKQIFGSFENNFVNPILVSRIILIFSYPDVISKSITINSFFDSLIKNQSNFIGGSCFLAVLLGFVYLIIKKIVNPLVPLLILLTSFLIPNNYYMCVLSGTILFCSVFLANDHVPDKLIGKVIFAVCCGVMTAILRLNTNVLESVLFALLFMQVFTPLIDKLLNLKFFKNEVKCREQHQ